MKRSVLSAALDLFLGRTDVDDTMRRLRQTMRRQRDGHAPRPTFADTVSAALAGRQSVEVFFRRIGRRH